VITGGSGCVKFNSGKLMTLTTTVPPEEALNSASNDEFLDGNDDSSKMQYGYS
jgi:hypothetical protein